MAFIPQNKLEQSLVEAQKDPLERPQFYKELVVSDLFIIQEAPILVEHGQKTLKEGDALQIRSVDLNGKAYLPVFSSLMRLQAFLPSEAGYIALNALEFMKLTRGADILLNPGSDYGKAFLKEEVDAIIQRAMGKPTDQYEVKKASPVRIGPPANYPTDLVVALSRYFEKRKEIKAAYLAHFFNPEHDTKAHTLVAMEVSGEWASVMSGIGMAIQGVPIPDPPVDFIELTGKSGVEDYFKNKSKPFYVTSCMK